MSTFNITDITPIGAYMNATTTARESDRRNAHCHFETGESRNVLKSLITRVQHFAAAVTEKRPVACQLAARPV